MRGRLAAEINQNRQVALDRRAAALAKEVIQVNRQAALAGRHIEARAAVEDAIGELQNWPRYLSNEMQRLGRSTQLSKRERFTFFLFMVGNGASPAHAVERMMASRSVPDRPAVAELEHLVKQLSTGELSEYRTYMVWWGKWHPIVCVP